MSKLDNPSPGRALVVSGALAGAIGVIAGALGAHFLRDTLEASGHIDSWKTAVLYNLLHAVAIVATGGKEEGVRKAAWLWLAGIVLFSGSLYAFAVGGPRWLAHITPFGGLSFVAGWVWFGVSKARHGHGGGP